MRVYEKQEQAVLKGSGGLRMLREESKHLQNHLIDGNLPIGSD